MSGLVQINSAAEWQSLLSSTNVVIADFYADWCGPCKMIAPTFESLSKEHSVPKKVAFAKINTDAQSGIARSNSITAMPTFKIFHGGNCVETIRGANPPALTAAVGKAVQLSNGAKPGDLFKSPGRTLGGEGGGGGGGMMGWDLNGIINMVIVAVGLYLVSLFTARYKKDE